MSTRLFWMQFNPTDWLNDTRRLTPAARGIWIDLLCRLWPTGTKTLTEAEWVRELSVTPDEFRAGLDELNHGKTADVTLCNNLVTINSRRMLRDATKREQTRNRVKSFRVRHTKLSSNAIELKSELDLELQIKKEKKKKEKRVSPSDADWLIALKANPAYSGIDVDKELARMDAWLSTPKGTGRKKTRSFVVNWLNKIEQPMKGEDHGQPKQFLDKDYRAGTW